MDPNPSTRRRPLGGRPLRARRRALLGLLSVLAVLAVALPLHEGVAAAAGPTLDMKVLVVSADGNETDLPAITTFLSQVGVPYDTLVASQRDLTADMLSDSPTHGRYQGIVLTTGNLVYTPDGGATWPSAFTTDEWNTLHAYQAAFGVRSVTSYTFPEAAYGLSYTGYQNTLGAKLPAQVTTAGQTVFPYLNPSGSVPLSGAWVYLGTVIDPTVTTPLITTTVGGVSYPVASVTTYPSGYQNLAITAANNPNLIHSMAFSYGWINWVTKGQFLGSQSASLNVQIDDLFATDDMWNPTTLTSSGTYRTRPADITALVRYQNTRRADAVTPGFMVEWAYNGETANASTDNLTKSVVANRAQFGFINHTFSHFNLDCGDCADPTETITTTAQQIQDEITRNAQVAASLRLPVQAATMVQPDISGINTPPNPMAQQAAAALGIRYWIGDTSRAGLGNPSFNTGFTTAGDSRLYVVPRHPSNLFFSVSTPAQWVSMYNYFYGPGGSLCGITTCFSTKQTYAQILDRESDYLVRYWLTGDLDPMMYHTPNARTYDGVHSTMTDVIDAALTKYKAMVRSPIRTNRFQAVGEAMQDRAGYDTSGVTASVTPCTSITLTTKNAAKIPVTGVSYTASNSTVSTFGGRTVSVVSLSAGQSVTIPLPAC